MTIGYIGDTSASGVALNPDGTLDYSGGPVGIFTSQDNCVAGGLDANGNTIVSCGVPGAGGWGLSLPPTCMPGDTLSAVNGQWICSSGSAASGGLPMSVLIPIGLLAVLAIMGARR